MGSANRKRSSKKTDPDATAGSTKQSEGEQAGDLQGLSDVATVDSQSIRELAGEGQSFEASVISGIENAPPADAGEVKTTEVPEDDVPLEYIERDKDVPKE